MPIDPISIMECHKGFWSLLKCVGEGVPKKPSKHRKVRDSIAKQKMFRGLHMYKLGPETSSKWGEMGPL